MINPKKTKPVAEATGEATPAVVPDCKVILPQNVPEVNKGSGKLLKDMTQRILLRILLNLKGN